MAESLFLVVVAADLMEQSLTDFEEALLSDLPGVYGLKGEPSECERMFVIHKDRVCLGFYADGRRYVLKEWNSDHSAEENRFRFGLLEYLLKRGFPLPDLHPAVGGAKLFEWKGRSFFLSDFVGEPYNPHHGREQLDACAVALGMLHGLTVNSTLAGWRWDWDPALRFPYELLEYWRSRLAESLLSATSRKRVGRCMDDMESMLRDVTESLTTADWYSLPHIPIHGEYNQFNCRFSGNQLAAVIDWEALRHAPRVLDVAYAMNFAVGWPVSREQQNAGRWPVPIIPEPGEIVSWLNQYRRFAPPIGEKEIALLPLLCAAIWPACCSLPLKEEEVEDCEMSAEYMRHLVDNAEALSALLHDSDSRVR